MYRGGERGLFRGESKDSIFPLFSCLTECRASLPSWNEISFGHVGKKLAALQARLEVIECNRGSAVTMEEIEYTRREINKLLEAEEVMWRQRSRISWLKHGDKNTSFFHTKASSRFQRNTIQGVMDEAGCWQSEEDGIGKTLEDYYVNLFSTSHPEISEELIHSIHQKVLDPMNILLSQDFWASEVESALKQMYATSAPGPNGIPPIFYQKFWPTVSPIVTKIVVDFLN